MNNYTISVWHLARLARACKSPSRKSDEGGLRVGSASVASLRQHATDTSGRTEERAPLLARFFMQRAPTQPHWGQCH